MAAQSYWQFFFFPFFPSPWALLQEEGGALGSSLTFLWTKYIRSLLLGRLKSRNNGEVAGTHTHKKGPGFPKYMQHQFEAVTQWRFLNLAVAHGMRNMRPLSFLSGQQRGSVSSQSPFLSPPPPRKGLWRPGRRKEMRARRASLRHRRNQPRTPAAHPGSAVSAAPSSYYRQQVQMVKGRCSVEKKKRKRRRGGEKKRMSTWSLCCSSLGPLSLWLALFLQQSAARNKTYNFIRVKRTAPLLLPLSYTWLH